MTRSISAEVNRVVAVAVTQALVDFVHERPIDIDAAWSAASLHHEVAPAWRPLFATAYAERRAALEKAISS